MASPRVEAAELADRAQARRELVELEVWGAKLSEEWVAMVARVECPVRRPFAAMGSSGRVKAVKTAMLPAAMVVPNRA